VDFLLILGTNRLSGYPTGGIRAAGAATLGSVYAAFCLFPGFRIFRFRIGDVFHNVFDPAVQNPAESIQCIYGNISVLSQCIQCPAAEIVIFFKFILRKKVILFQRP